jgi:hypothetical protein
MSSRLSLQAGSEWKVCVGFKFFHTTTNIENYVAKKDPIFFTIFLFFRQFRVSNLSRYGGYGFNPVTR